MAKRQNKFIKPALHLLIWVSLLTIIFISISLRFASAAPGRIAYWELNESSGTSFADSEAALHTGTCTNCPSPTTGEVSGGQSFNGVNDTITIPAHTAFNWGASGSFSVELWMQGSCAGSNETFIGRGTPAGGHWFIGCSPSTNGARFSLRDGTGSNITLDSTKIINDGNWHHIAATYDGTSGVSALHVDGSDTISTTHSFSGSFTPTSANITVGQINNTNYFNGKLDEIAIHNVVVPATELNTHYYLSRAYNASCDAPIAIMPLGDSITQGSASGVITESMQISYRYDLWHTLADNNYSVNFVGSRTQGEYYQPLDGFDPNHEGWPGLSDDQIAANVNGKLTLNPPDIVLLHAGTNAVETSTVGIENILDNIDQYDESITVILARIINRHPGDPLTGTTTQFNTNVGNLAQSRIALGDKIIVVDMENGAGLNYEYQPTGDMYNALHPFATGYTKMAAVWFGALETFMPQCLAPIITSTPVTFTMPGQTYVYDVEATGGPEPTYSIISPVSPPTGMTIDSNSGRITWTPTASGSVDVIVRAANDKGHDDQTFTINVGQLLFLPLVTDQ